MGQAKNTPCMQTLQKKVRLTTEKSLIWSDPTKSDNLGNLLRISLAAEEGSGKKISHQIRLNMQGMLQGLLCFFVALNQSLIVWSLSECILQEQGLANLLVIQYLMSDLFKKGKITTTCKSFLVMNTEEIF